MSGRKFTKTSDTPSGLSQLVNTAFRVGQVYSEINSLTPNDPYRGRTAPLTSKRCILYIYSTNIGTEYFKHGIYVLSIFSCSKCSLFHNSNLFGSCIIHTLYIQCVLKLKKIIIIIPAPKD